MKRFRTVASGATIGQGGAIWISPSGVQEIGCGTLDAKSIARPNPADGGASGVHIEQVLKRLGILEEDKIKTKDFGRPGDPQAMPGYNVATGQAEIALHQLQELLAVRGIDIVGQFPRELQGTFGFSAGVARGTKEADASQALVNFVRTPEAAGVIKAKGMDPAQ